MMTYNNDTGTEKGEGGDDNDRGSKHRCVLSPWYVSSFFLPFSTMIKEGLGKEANMQKEGVDPDIGGTSWKVSTYISLFSL